MAKTAKTVSAWKQKKAYVIVAPDNFESQEIGHTLASDPSRISGRTAKVSLGDLTGDRSKQYLTVVFELTDVNGDRVNTKFKKFYMAEGYLKSRIRKGSSKLDYMTESAFGGVKVKLKMMVLSRNRITTPQRKQIIGTINDILGRHRSVSFEQFLQAVIFGKFGTEIYKSIRTICAISRVEVYELKV